MDVDPFAPPPSGQTNLILENRLEPSAFGDLTNLQDIDDFDRQHGKYQPNLIHLQSNKASRENIDKLKLQCDKQRILPIYIDNEVFPQNWKSSVTIVRESFESPVLYPSKAHARDAAAKIAIESQVFANKQAVGVKRKIDDRQSNPVDKTEDWISLLYVNALQTKRFTPDFEEWSTPSPPYDYSCTVRLNGGPLEPFRSRLYAAKKDAKTGCAKLAVEWLRSNNHPQTPTKRPKHSDQIEADSIHTSLTQAIAAIDVDTHPEETYRQRLHRLVAMMGLQQPGFKLQLSAVTDAMPVIANTAIYDVAAFFKPEDVKRVPTLDGPFGEASHVFGKDNAKEECACRMLPVIEKIRESMMR